MTLLRQPGRLARGALTLTGLVSLFVLVFIFYAHIVSWRDAEVMTTSPRETHFTSATTLARDYTPHVSGGLTYAVRGDALVVHGVTSEVAASAEFEGIEGRLVESKLRLRFHGTTTGRFDVAIGLDTVAQTRRSIRLVIARSADRCMARLVGDPSALGPVTTGDRVIVEAPVVACDDQWHAIELWFCPELMRVIASIDDSVAFTPHVSWDAMTLVRPVFGVSAAEPGQDVGVAISEVSWRPVEVDSHVTDVDDRFRGKIVDPFWRVTRGEPAFVDGTFSTGARGLELTARALTHEGNVNAFELVTPSSPLGSFRASIDVDVTVLAHATFHAGIDNEPGPAWRLAQVGFLSIGDGKLVPFQSGHFENNGQGRFRARPEATHSIGSVSITFDYDATSRRARATFCGAPFFDEELDLPPGAISRFSVGTNVDDGGSLALTVQSVRIDHTRK